MTRRLAWIVIGALLAAALFTIARMKRDYVDFLVYQKAGQRALAAEPLYRAEDEHFQFKYLPAFALAMVPFARVNPELAKAIWFALSVACLLVFVRDSIVLLPDRRRSVRALAWITGLLIGKFVVKELVHGQTNIQLGWLILLGLVAIQRGHRVAGGAFVGLAAFAKPYAILVLPWLLVTAGVASVVSAVAVIAAGLLLPAAVYGWTGNLQELAGWYQTVTSTTPENLLFGENISIATMWAKWIGPGTTATVLAVATCLAALGAAGLTVMQRRRVDTPNYLELACLLLLIPLLSPQGWDYVLLLGTPAIVLLVDRWADLSRMWRVVAGVGLLTISFTIYDLVGRVMYRHMLAWSVDTVAVLALVAVLVHVRWKGIG